jgi:basic amino acid/polyamine antiporter, APA family
MSTRTALPPPVSLRRALGRWDLTAIGINQVIGGAVFLMPSQVAAQVGSWSPVAFVLVGFASLLVSLCFAEVSSRFEGSGGAYLYARAAFGRFVGFEIGWMQWFTRVSSQASVMSGIALALGYYWPGVTAGLGRTSLLVVLTTALGVVNVRGIRQSAWLVNVLTVGKLVPLAVFAVVGTFSINRALLFQSLPPVTVMQASSAALLLIFVFGGYDVISVPAAEAMAPRRDIPFAFVATIVAVTLVLVWTQIVAQGTLSDLSAHATPIADSAWLLMGPIGALLVGVGSMVSMTGNNAGQILTGSRMLFALADNRELPAFFAAIHPRFRTPVHAVVFTAAVALLLALTGSFVTLAIASAVARLMIYTSACMATIALRQPRFATRVKPATFIIPLGPTIPLLGTAISLAMIWGATRGQLVGGLAALLVGAALFVLNARNSWRSRVAVTSATI